MSDVYIHINELRHGAGRVAVFALLVLILLGACSCGRQRPGMGTGSQTEILVAYNASGYLEDEITLLDGTQKKLAEIFDLPPDLGYVLSFSAGGTVIAGAGLRDRGLLVYRRLVLRNPDGTGDLLQNPGPGRFGEKVKKVLFPTISQDGSRLMTVEGFPVGSRLEDAELFVVNVDGSGKRCVFRWSGPILLDGQYPYRATPGCGHALVYRPGEGTRMAVVDASEGRQLYEWAVDGPLQTVSNVMELVDMSTDGRRVVFVSPDSESPCDRAGRPRGDCLCLVDVMSRRTSVLARARDFGPLGAYDSLRLSHPQWSPDGKSVLVTCWHGGRRLVVVTLDGGQRVLAGLGGGWDAWAGSWLPDGRRISFLSAEPGSPPWTCVAPVDGGWTKPLSEVQAQERERVYRWAVLDRPPVVAGSSPGQGDAGR